MSNGDDILTPLGFLSPSTAAPKHRSGLIVLNTPLSSVSLFKNLWSHSIYCICADGGANRLHDLLSNTPWLESHLPSQIHGDLDSLRPSTRSFYSSHDVPITHDPDQYSTDFGKSISVLHDKVPDITDVLILGSIAGRVDQGLGLLGELLREHRQHAERGVRLWLFSESSISFVLDPGTTRIALPLDSGLIGECVGVIPIFGPARIGMKGFEWDVQDWETRMGGMVSSSNHIRRDVVEVSTDVHVLFTVERKDVVAAAD